ncbi:MAG: DUF2341 domain-containing protein [Methylococcaceae bacterium]
MKRFCLLLIFLTLVPTMASAWWNEDWGNKKKMSLDVKKLQQDGVVIPDEGFALVRLHTGNFANFLSLAENGKDFRLLASDEKTPLNFFIEKLDPVNEMAFIWVQLPTDIKKETEPAFWLYYGNPEAVDAQDSANSFAVSQVLSYPFEAGSVVDKTANSNNPSEVTATYIGGGLIAGAEQFQGSQVIRIPSAPSLQMGSATGFTVSTWIKVEQTQKNSVVFQRSGSNGSLALIVKDQTPYLVLGADGVKASKQEFASQTTLTPAVWHHLAVVANADSLSLYVDGAPAGNFPAVLPELVGDMTIGADALGANGFVGLMDQFAIFKSALDANAIKFDVAMQGAGSTSIAYGDDATPDSEEGGESYMMSTLNNVTIDGWVIIGILGVMFVISFMVMILKAIVINKIQADNKKFERAFSKLGTQNLSTLNSDADEDEDEDEDDSSALLSLTRDGSGFSNSSIYRIYHVGVQEMNKRLDKSSGDSKTLSAGAMSAVRASMDAVLVRESQRLNSQMVLLTIAISGGPFLGLLGTVVGVMITFAAIAVSGEVNVNSIAPGIAAALAATVAGLTVAIPALFGYNYLGSRIKVISADMHVFVDEFVAKLAEEHT